MRHRVVVGFKHRHVRWFSRDVGRYFPEEWARFRAGVPEADRNGDLVAAYDRLLNAHPDPAVRLKAARDWVAWEDAILSLEEGYVTPNPRWADERFMVGFARLVTHYFSHAECEEDELLRTQHDWRASPLYSSTVGWIWLGRRMSPSSSPRLGRAPSSIMWPAATRAMRRWSSCYSKVPTVSRHALDHWPGSVGVGLLIRDRVFDPCPRG